MGTFFGLFVAAAIRKVDVSRPRFWINARIIDFCEFSHPFVGHSVACRFNLPTMASKSVARYLVRQQYLSRSSVPVLNVAAGKSPSRALTGRRRATTKLQHHNAVQIRSLSTSRPKSYARVEESLDFREQDRESDEVDVCIVGGGNYSTCSLPSID